MTISGTSGTSTGYTGGGALVASAGNVVLTGVSTSGSAVNFSGTVTASAGNVVITGNSFDQVGNGVYAYGNITDNANGGSVTFRSNNNINQTGTISMVANTSGHASAITYDVSTGNKTSSIVTTNSVIATGSTSGIDYNMFASGAVLNAGALPAIPGIITIDNTFGAATVGATPASGYLTTGNLALATTSNAIVINSGQPLVGQYGVTLRAATNGTTASKSIIINDNITSVAGSVVLDGVAGSGYAVYYPSAGYGLSGQSISVIGNNLGTSTIAPVSIGKLSVLAGGGSLDSLRAASAMCEMLSRARLTHRRPSFGIDEVKCNALGLRVCKIGCTWPIEPEGLKEFAQGLELIICAIDFVDQQHRTGCWCLQGLQQRTADEVFFLVDLLFHCD